MTAAAIFPLATIREGTAVNALPANANSVLLQAALEPALDFANAAPTGAVAGDQYVIGTAWGGFTSGNIVVSSAGAWHEFASFNGLVKTIGGKQYVYSAGTWTPIIEWVGVPGSSSASGVEGQLAFDADFLYVCTAADTWTRTALTADITPPPTPPTPALLLHYELPTIVDSSANNLPVTVALAALVQAPSPVKFGGSSLSVEATGGGIGFAYVNVSDPVLVAGTGDFTVDMWIYITSLSAERILADSRLAAGTASGFALTTRAGGYFGIFDGAQYLGTDSAGQSGATLTLNGWTHIECGRHAGTIYLFINGALVAESSEGQFSNDFASQSWTFHAGQYFPIGVEHMPGYADEVRVVIGTCHHTSSFIPPTAPY